LTSGPLAAGTVVVLDEISQTPTREVEAVLAAVDACPGGSVWLLGDPRQSQPVGAGGVAEHIERLAAEGRMPSGRLTVNRRQVEPADRQVLDLLRRGEPTASQRLRAEHGWEHEHASPAQNREAMAEAVCTDFRNYGADQVAALVVSHADAEDLADRIRARLTETGMLTGPTLSGPGWVTNREYRVGDRVLLHARFGPAGSRLVNGTTATITRVEAEGLTIRVDRSRETAVLSASFVGGTRKDGAPNLSHSWARTIDGAQGGTWQSCHLLGSCALDSYRGYTGQSRSRQPTHTWNTVRVGVLDHGGTLADQRDAAEQVADALARRPDPSLAARSDPWTLDRRIRDVIAEHESVLAGRPPDPSHELDTAARELASAQNWLANMTAIASHTAQKLDGLGTLAGLTKKGREQRRVLEDKLAGDAQRATAASDRYDEVALRVKQLSHAHEIHERFQADQKWRQDDMTRLREQLDRHWTGAVAACVRADDPLAFGIAKLRHARSTTEAGIGKLDGSIPADRSAEWQGARGQLADTLRDRHQAERALADHQTELEAASQRRWGRHDHRAIAAAQREADVAKQRVTTAAVAEHALRELLAGLARHQEGRQKVIAATAAERRELVTMLGQLDAALGQTRAARVRALFDDPPSYLTDRLGPTPPSPAGRAVWCHHAVRIEATLDRNDGTASPWTGWEKEIARARQEIAIADRIIQSQDTDGPAHWARLADQAASIVEQAHRNSKIRTALDRLATAGQQPPPILVMEHAAHRREPEVGM
jgi:hypothetical protein